MNTLKRYRSVLLLLGAVILSSPHVYAEESCQIRLGQTEVDFGYIQAPGNAPHLDAHNLYTVGTRYVSLSASCPSSSKLVVLLRGDSLVERFRFASRGQMRVRLSNALLDGRTVDLASIRAMGDVPGQAAPMIDVAPNDLIVPVSGGLVAEGSLLSLQIEISPGVGLDEFKARDSKTLEGNLSFELRKN